VTLGFGQRAVVVDASVAVSFILGDPQLVDRWREWTTAGDMIVVPPHFGHEVANALLRSAGVGATATVAALDRLFSVGIEVVDRGLMGLNISTGLAEVHGLTVYDAAYLYLALDVDGELATRDRDLMTAAAAEGVEVDE
jgi:predicted nucleic acid-binding protein